MTVESGVAGDLGAELGFELVERGQGLDGVRLLVEELAADLIGEASTLAEGLVVELVLVLEFLTSEWLAVVLDAVHIGQAADVDHLRLISVVSRADAVDVVEIAMQDEEGVGMLVVGGGCFVLDEGVGEVRGGELGEGLLGGETGGDGHDLRCVRSGC